MYSLISNTDRQLILNDPSWIMLGELLQSIGGKPVTTYGDVVPAPEAAFLGLSLADALETNKVRVVLASGQNQPCGRPEVLFTCDASRAGADLSTEDRAWLLSIAEFFYHSDGFEIWN
jgi:hypothetical protein